MAFVDEARRIFGGRWDAGLYLVSMCAMSLGAFALPVIAAVPSQRWAFVLFALLPIGGVYFVWKMHALSSGDIGWNRLVPSWSRIVERERQRGVVASEWAFLGALSHFVERPERFVFVRRAMIAWIALCGAAAMGISALKTPMG